MSEVRICREGRIFDFTGDEMYTGHYGNAGIHKKKEGRGADLVWGSSIFNHHAWP